MKRDIEGGRIAAEGAGEYPRQEPENAPPHRYSDGGGNLRAARIFFTARKNHTAPVRTRKGKNRKTAKNIQVGGDITHMLELL